MKNNKIHWTATSTRNFLFRIGADFVSQILDNIESQNELADKTRLSKGRVSQTLHNPGNLTLETMIKYARAIGMKATVVLYDKDNDDRPIHPKIFHECWQKLGSPRDVFELTEQQYAVTTEGSLDDDGKTFRCLTNINTFADNNEISLDKQVAVNTLNEDQKGDQNG